MKTRIATSAFMLASAIALSAQSIVRCEIVVPVLDLSHRVVTASAPDGHSYPVFQVALQSKLVDEIRHTLDTSFAQQALRLDRYARNLILARRREAHVSESQEWLTSPMYLLMSTEEGGFARFGFWLQDSSGKRRLVLAGYVDLVIRDGLSDGIFSHELGHLILKTLTGGVQDGQSRKMHQSMTVTDYPTAFDEGYAEHFEPLARDFDAPKPDSGAVATDFDLFWLSAADGQLRIDGVKRNLFVHRKPLPESAFDEQIDLYRLFVDAETSTAFLPTTLKNGQQMMASEGVVSTLFYRIVNDDQLRSHYREPSFYRPFLPDDSRRPKDAITPAENVNLKLFAAMTELRGFNRDQPPMISLVEHYAKLFPDEAKRIYRDFIVTTWGATASQQLASQLMRTAEDGGRGDISAFRRDEASSLFDTTIADVTNGKRTLDDNLGPELWIVNSEFKIASAMWVTDRQLPLTINLNTATEPELMTIGGVDFAAARKIIRSRDTQGFFHNLDDLYTIVSPEIMRKLKSMSKEMKRLPAYQRE
ncbi:MAG TPA: helix-hairpin-helix domain-containing protein [Candidatus Angelobacter sp.]